MGMDKGGRGGWSILVWMGMDKGGWGGLREA